MDNPPPPNFNIRDISSYEVDDELKEDTFIVEGLDSPPMDELIHITDVTVKENNASVEVKEIKNDKRN